MFPMNKKTTGYALLAVLFIVSAVFYGLKEDKYSRIVLHFFNENTNELCGEERFILLSDTTEENVEKIVVEILSGPMSIFNRPLLPPGVKIRKLIITDNEVNLDLSLEAVLNRVDGAGDLEEALEIFKKNIFFNIKEIKSVTITIEGQLINHHYFDYEQAVND